MISIRHNLQIVLIILLAFFAHPIFAQSEEDVQIFGSVDGSAILPVPQVVIAFYPVGSETPDKVVSTNKQGHFQVPLRGSQSHQLTFRKGGFRTLILPLPKSQETKVDSGQIILSPDPSQASQIKPVTACEILADLKKYSGKPVAVVGRLDCFYS